MGRRKVGVKRLAIQVDDHDLEFDDFEGEIPAGEYGAGQVEIWDRGTYESASWSDDEITFKFNGTRLHGTYTLIRFPRGAGKAWLMFKRGEESQSHSATRFSGCCAKLRRDLQGFW